MKVGALVTLSSYGRKCKFNSRIYHADEGNVGIIVKINQMHSYPYEVLWSKYADSPARNDCHTRRELKYAKRFRYE